MRVPLVLAALGLSAATSLPAQGVDSHLVPYLVRCVAQSDAACLRVDVTLRPEQAARYAAADLAGDAGSWLVALGSDAYPAAVATVPARTSLPLRVLILVDMSGSMAGTGLEVTRSALRSFLFDLPDSVLVAIAPFESRQVEGRIRGVPFVTRDSAFRQLESLPEPTGNTALYSAAAAGVERLAAELEGLDADAWGGLLLITDGANDVGHAGDDPGLLAGPDGRAMASEALAGAGIQPWLVGIGATVSAAELTALAGPGGVTVLAGTDPLELGRAFAAIQGWLLTERELLFVLPAGVRSRLTGRETALELRFRAAGEGAGQLVGAARYHPPVFALPAFDGVAAASDSAGVLLGSMPAAPALLDRRWPMLLFFAALWLVLWVAVPRALWPAETPTAAAEPAAAAAAESSAPGPGGGLRIDVEEAPPRSPAEVTGAFRAVRR